MPRFAGRDYLRVDLWQLARRGGRLRDPLHDREHAVLLESNAGADATVHEACALTGRGDLIARPLLCGQRDCQAYDEQAEGGDGSPLRAHGDSSKNMVEASGSTRVDIWTGQGKGDDAGVLVHRIMPMAIGRDPTTIRPARRTAAGGVGHSALWVMAIADISHQ
jgi:hypothetical protein